jgi:hypothetical protein
MASDYVSVHVNTAFSASNLEKELAEALDALSIVLFRPAIANLYSLASGEKEASPSVLGKITDLESLTACELLSNETMLLDALWSSIVSRQSGEQNMSIGDWVAARTASRVNALRSANLLCDVPVPSIRVVAIGLVRLNIVNGKGGAEEAWVLRERLPEQSCWSLPFTLKIGVWGNADINVDFSFVLRGDPWSGARESKNDVAGAWEAGARVYSAERNLERLAAAIRRMRCATSPISFDWEVDDSRGIGAGRFVRDVIGRQLVGLRL